MSTRLIGVERKTVLLAGPLHPRVATGFSFLLLRFQSKTCRYPSTDVCPFVQRQNRKQNQFQRRTPKIEISFFFFLFFNFFFGRRQVSTTLATKLYIFELLLFFFLLFFSFYYKKGKRKKKKESLTGLPTVQKKQVRLLCTHVRRRQRSTKKKK